MQKNSVVVVGVGILTITIIILALFAVGPTLAPTLSQLIRPSIQNEANVEESSSESSPISEAIKMRVEVRVQDSGSPWVFLIDGEVNPTLTAKSGATTIEFVFINDGITVHDFTIDELGITAVDTLVDPGETKTITVEVQNPGEFAYYCSQPGHRDLGMQGKLIVV